MPNPEYYTVPCKRCGRPTPMIGTRLCNGCWELQTRIKSQPELAMQILRELGYLSAKVEE